MMEMTQWETGTEIEMGLYPQGEMVASPITWVVLRSLSDKALVVSKKILEKRQFDSSWHSSDLRKWLNTSFFEAAFSETEKSMIIETVILNNACLVFFDDWDPGELPGPDSLGRIVPVDDPPTRDRIFLLDVRELLEDPSPDEGLYDHRDLVHVLRDNTLIPFSKLLSNTDDWWLRNKEIYTGEFGYVQGNRRVVASYPIFSRTQGKEIKGVRPAMWIKRI